MWLLNIFLGGKLSRKIPNYHNEEDAFRLLQNWWTEYVPAPTSIIKDLQITWTKGGVRVLQPSPPKEIPNPFQLRPSSIKNKIISFRDKTQSRKDTNRTKMLRGIWNTNGAVGPLEGKPYEKEIPVKQNVIQRTFYILNPIESFVLPVPIISNNYSEIRSVYESVYKLRDELKQPLLVQSVKQMMATVGLEDSVWYTPTALSIGQPINYNPLTKNLSEYFVDIEWGEYLELQVPLPDVFKIKDTSGNDLADPRSALENRRFVLVEAFNNSQEKMNYVIEEWIEGDAQDYFTRERDEYGDPHWSIDSDWAPAMAKNLLGEPDGIYSVSEHYVNSLIHLKIFDSFIAEGINIDLVKLQAFLNTGCMRWIMALQLPEGYDEIITEHISTT